MNVDVDQTGDGLGVLKLSGALTRANAVQDLSRKVGQLKNLNRCGVLLDLSEVHRMNMAGLAALIELVSRNPKTDFGFCALPPKPLAFLRKSGLDRGLLIFPSVTEAQEHPQFQMHILTGVPTVLLCAGKGSRVAPLTDVTPKPLLDVAGRPTLHRIINHLRQFGLRDITLNPGHLGYQIIDYFRSKPMSDTRISFVNEGHWQGGHWQSSPIGSASTLKRMQDQNAAFDGDLVVLCGDALIDLNMAEMMRAHRASGAAATIAALTVTEAEVHKYGIIEAAPDQTVTRFIEKPNLGVTSSRLANSGIYIFKSDVLDLISRAEGLDIACDLLPAIMASGQKMHVYDNPFSWVDIGCGRDYAVASRKCLEGDAPFARPMGIQIRPRVWAMPDAVVSHRAVISGPCYVGSGARIEAGATLNGVCSVGARAVVEGRTLLQDSIVMPDTRVSAGAWADNMVLHANWAVDHRYADGSLQNRSPHEYVGPIEIVSSQDIKKSA